MSDYVKQATEAGDQYLAAIAEGQENFIKALGPYSQLVTSAAATAPAIPPQYAADLPTMQEIAEANFAFATKLLKQQKKFTDKFLSAAVPG